MAIQVGGTTVINNSRQLQNIASVDATTVAALGSAGVGGGKNNVSSLLVVASETFTVPFACDMHVLVCGGGGGGAACATGTENAGNGRATGGAAGGVAIKLFTGVSAGASVSITIGAPGAFAQLSTANGAQAVSGGTGGNTSVTYSGTTVTGNGGGGGTAAANTTDRTSNAGGSASGGDTSVTGATSSTGYVTAHTAGGGSRKASAGARASSVSSTQGVATLDQYKGSGNFTTTPVHGHQNTSAEQFEQIYGSILAFPAADLAGNYYSRNSLFFGLQSAGGLGVTNYQAYVYGPTGLPGHLGGGGGAVTFGHNGPCYYAVKNDEGNQVLNVRGGKGGTGFVHLEFLKAAEDL